MDMDLGARLRLGVPMDDTGHPELISKLFALITIKCEEGAAQAIKGQGQGKDLHMLEGLANRLQCVGEEITIVAEAAGALVQARG